MAIKKTIKKKVMKSKKSMKKTMKRKAKKDKVKIAKGKMRYSVVFRGHAEKTGGGLKKEDIKKNKLGKFVSKKMSENAIKVAKRSGFMRYFECVKKARNMLGVKGFQAVGGKSAKGQALLKKVRSLYKK